MTAEPFDAARALRWLKQLERNNDRVWFAAHRDVYDEHLKPEWEDLVAALLVALVPLDERFAYVDPRACIFRLARDIRFSNDKTPFKTRLSAWLSPLGKSGANAGFYVSVTPAGAHFSCGIYTPEKPALEALRRTLAEDARPLERILRTKRVAPYLPLETDPLTRIPRGFPKDHPNEALIRARNYLICCDYSPAELTATGAYATFRRALQDCAPFVRFIDEAIGTAVQNEAPDDF